MTRRTLARRRLAVLVAALVALSGCGLTTNDEPQTLADDVPFDLLAPRASTTTTTSTTAPAVVSVELPVYLVGSQGRLVPVVRTLAAPVTAADLLKVLLEGATDDEAATGLRSVIKPDTTLRGVTLQPDGVAVVDLSTEFGSVQGEEGITAVAQVVFTVTELEAVRRVAFAIAGQAIDVPDGDGTLTSRPLRRIDFPERRPNVSPSSTSPEPADGAQA